MDRPQGRVGGRTEPGGVHVLPSRQEQSIDPVQHRPGQRRVEGRRDERHDTRGPEGPYVGVVQSDALQPVDELRGRGHRDDGGAGADDRHVTAVAVREVLS
jgi:hypothetical protein